MEELTKSKNNYLNIYKKKESPEYSNKRIIVSDLIDNEDLSIRIFSIILKEEQIIDGPIMLHKGNEFLYIIQGSLNITVETKEHTLQKAESALLSNFFIKKWHNKDNKIPCEFIYILL